MNPNKDNGTAKLLLKITVPQGLLRTLSQPSLPPGQERLPIHPHLWKVIEPVSIIPMVARTAVATLALLDP